jgi:uncharacterized protein
MMTDRSGTHSRRSDSVLIWVLDPGHPGELNQCLGLAKVLVDRSAESINIVRLELRSKNLAPFFRRALASKLFSKDRPRWLAMILYRLLFKGPRLNDEIPTITVSTLGRGEMPALFLQQFFGSRAFHIGVPKRMPSNCFDLIVRMPTQHMQHLDGPTVTLDIAPTPVTLEDGRYTSPLIARWRTQARRLCAVLIGGDGSGYKYRQNEWSDLAKKLADLSSNRDLGILLTTSRRTGTVAENELKSNAGLQRILVHAHWFGQRSESTLRDFLAAADFVICTEESRSMISDAIAAGKAVYTIRPQHAYPHEARLLELVASQETARRIKRVRFDDVGDLDIDADRKGYFAARSECWSVTVLREIEQSLPALYAVLAFERTGAPHDIERTSRE